MRNQADTAATCFSIPPRAGFGNVDVETNRARRQVYCSTGPVWLVRGKIHMCARCEQSARLSLKSTGESRVFFFAFFSFSLGFAICPVFFSSLTGFRFTKKLYTATGLLHGRGRTPRPVLLLFFACPCPGARDVADARSAGVGGQVFAFLDPKGSRDLDSPRLPFEPAPRTLASSAGRPCWRRSANHTRR